MASRKKKRSIADLMKRMNESPEASMDLLRAKSIISMRSAEKVYSAEVNMRRRQVKARRELGRDSSGEYKNIKRAETKLSVVRKNNLMFPIGKQPAKGRKWQRD